MAIIRWDPWGERALDEHDRDEFTTKPHRPDGDRLAGLVPPIDAFRTNEGVVVHVELPGIRPEDVDVSVHDDILRIKGERRRSRQISDEAYIHRESSVGRFERAFSLPEASDPEGVTANFEHGVLELRIPYAAQRQPQRIQVRKTMPRVASDGENGG